MLPIRSRCGERVLAFLAVLYDVSVLFALTLTLCCQVLAHTSLPQAVADSPALVGIKSAAQPAHEVRLQILPPLEEDSKVNFTNAPALTQSMLSATVLTTDIYSASKTLLDMPFSLAPTTLSTRMSRYTSVAAEPERSDPRNARTSERQYASW